MGNKGKKRDVHITRKAPIFLNLAQRKHHVKAPSYADVNIQVRKGHLNILVIRNCYYYLPKFSGKWKRPHFRGIPEVFTGNFSHDHKQWPPCLFSSN
jgi:hypothetical protein